MLTFVSFTAFAIYLHSCLFTLIHFRGSPNSQSVLDLKDEIIFRGKICKIYQSSENNHSVFMKEKKIKSTRKKYRNGEQTTSPFAKKGFTNLGVFPRMTESSTVFIV